MCGGNVSSGLAHACQQILLPRGRPASAVNLAFARRVLKSMYPKSIDITLQGGGIAQLPTASQSTSALALVKMYVPGVAVCSYVQPTPAGLVVLLAGRAVVFQQVCAV